MSILVRPLILVAAISIVGCVAACDRNSDTEPSAATAPSAAAPAAPAAPPAAAAGACPPSGGLNYVCGPRNAEDIVALPNSDWLIASGMSAQGANPTTGHLYLVDRRAKTYEEWFPTAAPSIAPDAAFADCPGPIDPANFSAHGLALREQSPGRHRLYITSHGQREAIEVFDVAAAGAKPAITWIGCVVLPERTFANSVAILEDGGFVTTKMMDPTAQNGFAGILAGEISGNVYEWHPGGAVTAVPGTELSGANGIEVSADQRYLFVAAIGSREIVRFDRQTSPHAKEAVLIDIRPDNLRWTPEGKLYTAGGNFVPPAECASPPCSTGWSVVEVDPQTLQATRIGGVDQTAALQGASTALAVDDEIWVGTFNGDRIGYLPKP
jgi:hypothetical protein